MTPEPAPGIHRSHKEPGVPARPRVGEGDQAPGMVGGGPEESGIIGIAADHPVEGHDVRGIDGRRDRAEVGVSKGHPIRVPQPLRLGRSDGDVGLGGVNLGGAREAVLEQNVVNDTNPSADIEERRAGGKGTPLHRGQELPCSWIGAPAMKAAQVVIGQPAIELLLGSTAMADGHTRVTGD